MTLDPLNLVIRLALQCNQWLNQNANRWLHLAAEALREINAA